METGTAALEAARPLGPVPGETEIVLLSFEGPDDYARRGDLGTHVAGLGTAFADAGFSTTLIFVGDPGAPHDEVVTTTPLGGRLRLVRWSQWISRYYPGGPYEDEEARVHDYATGVPEFLARQEILTDLAGGPQSGAPHLVVLAHEWQTAGALLGIHTELQRRGQRHQALLTWTVRHPLNLAHVDLGALQGACSIATVSRYMKHELWKSGLDPLVFPPGLNAEHFAPPDADLAAGAAALAEGRTLLFCPTLPIPWEHAIYSAVAALKGAGHQPLLVVGSLGDGTAGLGNLRANRLGPLSAGGPPMGGDVLIATDTLSSAERRALFGAATATLLLGDTDVTGTALLAAMAGGAVAVTEAAMSDPLIPFENGVALETRTAAEVSATLTELAGDHERLAEIRQNARRTAEGYSWPRTLATLRVKLSFLATARR